jgi:hypothetical protein
MLKNIVYFSLKTLITLFLIPADIIGIEWIARNLQFLDLKSNKPFIFFLAGVLIYVIIHLFVIRFTWLHVLAHELTHALFSLLSGGKVLKIKVSSKGGYVRVSHSNLLVTLAPYFFPFYLAIFLAIWFIIKHFYGEVIKEYNNYIILFFGFLLGFHLLFTIESLHTQQPDLKVFGIIFSLALIIFANELLVAITLKIFSPATVSLKNLWEDILFKEKIFWIEVLNILKKYTPIAVNTIAKLFSNAR